MPIFPRKKNSREKRLDTPDMTVPPRPVPPGLDYAVANVQGVGARERQEDSFTFGHALDQVAIAKEGLLFVVADGMGGMANGKLASDTVVKSIASAYDKFDMSADISLQLVKAVISAGETVYDILDGAGGSTVIAAVIYDDKLYFASVGDSFAYLFRNRQLVRLNSIHNLLNEEYARTISYGSLDPTEAKTMDDRETLTQFLGMPALDEIDGFIKPLKLFPGDVIMLCSDGIAGFLSEACISECLSHGLPMNMCSSLKKEIEKVKHKFQDNYTALVVQCRKK